MGTVVNFGRGVKLQDAAQRVVVPELPWAIDAVLSPNTNQAMADACRAIGRYEGTVRMSGRRRAVTAAVAAADAWASARASMPTLRWSQFGEAFANSDTGRHCSGEETSLGAGQLALALGLWEPFTWPEVLRSATARFSGTGTVPPRYAADLEGGLTMWSSREDVAPIVRAGLAMMSVAAVDPHDPGVGAAARVLFEWILRATQGTTRDVPISWGFHGFHDAWTEVAGTLATGGDPAPGAVDRALLLVCEAVERAAIAATFTAERVGWGDLRTPSNRGAEAVAALPANSVAVAHVVCALPKVSVGQVRVLMGRSPRVIATALRALEDAAVVRLSGRASAPGTVVTPTVRSAPALEAVHSYPSVRTVGAAT